jgi:hypothetical protein
MSVKGILPRAAALALASALTFGAAPARAALDRPDPDGWTLETARAAWPELFTPIGELRARPAAVPDVVGHGAVLTVGNLIMKVTNFGHCGNFFTNLSSDPSAQWPGVSGVEYLESLRLAVGAVNPEATDPVSVRRVSYFQEWRPPTLDPEDRIYQAYDGIVNGTRFANDDGDHDELGKPKIDEDFLDGRDNDGDGKIDEDYGALGQQMFSCVMRDDTPQALNATFNEKHSPRGLEVRQRAWAYSIPGFSDFCAIEYQVRNVSGHVLDSLVIGWLVNMDAGVASQSDYFRDDLDLPGYPSGEFTQITLPNDKRLQDSTMLGPDPTNPNIPADSALCPRFTIRINGFSIADDNGDDGQTKGIPSFLLIHHTVDPLGVSGPARVGFRAFRSFTVGTPYAQGGNPIIDQQRYEFMVSQQNIDPETGFINARPGDSKGDYVEWCSVGPWRNVPDGGTIEATVALAVRAGDYQTALPYMTDYQRFKIGELSWAYMKDRYQALDNAYAIQVAYEGIWIDRPDLSGHPEWDFLPNGHGRETPLIAARGTGSFQAAPDCRDLTPRTVTELAYDWFDYDCDYCTGAYDSKLHRGMFHQTWNVGAPPPNPNVNVSSVYNYADNPDRHFAPAGDRQVTLAWDNLSEATPDPKTGQFDFRGYKIWKVANWTRPAGSSGPSDADWSLLGEYRQFNYRWHGRWVEANYDPAVGTSSCPQVYVPNYYDPATQQYVGPRTVPICLQRHDFWDRQTGIVLRPDTTVRCTDYPQCTRQIACILNTQDCSRPSERDTVTHYPIGRYHLVDREVKNGFAYFYAVTAFDSTAPGTPELGGRRSAIEADAVVPQIAAMTGKSVWVVPNPYRGFSQIARRPSSWDMTPNATDPTGTHIDFYGLPPGRWTIRIYTLSGDLVQELHWNDPVNESLRVPVNDANGTPHPGYNRQQDNPNDGQARWNLISRNGQDIVSGVYMFTVESGQGTQRGKFVVIR